MEVALAISRVVLERSSDKPELVYLTVLGNSVHSLDKLLKGCRLRAKNSDSITDYRNNHIQVVFEETRKLLRILKNLTFLRFTRSESTSNFLGCLILIWNSRIRVALHRANGCSVFLDWLHIPSGEKRSRFQTRGGTCWYVPAAPAARR